MGRSRPSASIQEQACLGQPAHPNAYASSLTCLPQSGADSVFVWEKPPVRFTPQTSSPHALSSTRDSVSYPTTDAGCPGSLWLELGNHGLHANSCSEACRLCCGQNQHCRNRIERLPGKSHVHTPSLL